MPFDNTPWPPTTKEIEFLKAIGELLREKGWCQSTYSQTEDGSEAGVFDEDASRFCVVGAALRISQKREQEFGYLKPGEVVARLLGFADDCEVYDWNDRLKTKRSVLRKINKSINLLQAKAMADTVT